MYVVSQIIKTATVLYLVSLPMGMLLGLPESFMIIGMGVFVTCYSLAGPPPLLLTKSHTNHAISGKDSAGLCGMRGWYP